MCPSDDSQKLGLYGLRSLASVLSGAITENLGLSRSERIKAWLAHSSQGCVVQMHNKGSWNFLSHHDLRRCSVARQNNSFLLLFIPVKSYHEKVY